MPPTSPVELFEAGFKVGLFDGAPGYGKPGSCPVCEEAETVALPNNLSRCPACSHVFQTDLRITCRYDVNYALQYEKLACESMSAARCGLLLGLLDLPEKAKILDVGYANGAFLKSMARIGYDVYGIDLHGHDFGIREVSFDDELDFNLTCFFDSLEHFSDLELPLKIKTDYAIVSLPNMPPFFPERPEAWKHYKPGEHLHYFTAGSLDYYMRRWGLARKLAFGHTEDVVRGRYMYEGRLLPNIYTAVYGRN